MKRREFIKTTLGSAGLLSLNGINNKLFASPSKKYANDIVKLGNTGIKVSRLAMGTGSSGWRGSSNQTRELGIKGLAELLNTAYERGINFWDSADQYGTHPHLKEALKTIPRDNVVILTKTHASTEKEMEADLDRFRNEIGTDYLDIVLLHNMQDENWHEEKAGAMEVLSKARENSIVKAHGVSCHTLKALKTAANNDWVQIDLVRYNPAGVHMDDEPAVVAEVIEQMKAKGKGIIGMKVFGAGKLIDRYDECVAYHVNSSLIDSSTVGFQSIAEFEQYMTKVPQVS